LIQNEHDYEVAVNVLNRLLDLARSPVGYASRTFWGTWSTGTLWKWNAMRTLRRVSCLIIVAGMCRVDRISFLWLRNDGRVLSSAFSCINRTEYTLNSAKKIPLRW